MPPHSQVGRWRSLLPTPLEACRLGATLPGVKVPWRLLGA